MSESTRTRKKVLVTQPSLQPPGGSNAVASWVLQALRGCYDVSLLTTKPCDCNAVNRFFGTSLKPSDFRLHLTNTGLHALLDVAPTPLSLLHMCLFFRATKAHLKTHHYDAVISTANEVDFGQRGIQYIHFPWGYLPRPEVDLRWYHAPAALLEGYRATCKLAIGGFDVDGMRKNLSLVNSDYIAGKMHEAYCVDSTTLYPPVPGFFPEVPWIERDNGFVCVGRISPEKDQLKLIEILAQVRERGHDINFHLVGTPDSKPYTRAVFELAARHQTWVNIHIDLPRGELVDLMANNRYGIHGMAGEHFGIVVAELQRAGCIVFVPDEGGPVEIVGGDERLLYGNVQQAVHRIDRVLSDSELQISLSEYVLSRKELFSADRFVDQLRTVVRDFSR